MKVYGPYKNKDGRCHVVLYDPVSKNRKTESYARYLYKKTYGAIPDGMTVDHIDGDRTNDKIENLQILTLKDNIKKSAKLREMINKICPECGIEFSASMRRIRDSQYKQKKAGPFCSQRCAGKRNERLRIYS